MDLEFTPEERAFRDEVRAFIRDNLPSELVEKTRRNIHLDKSDIVAWHKILHKQGWGAPNWPKEYGGPGWSPVQRYIFDEETVSYTHLTLPTN